MQYEDGRESLFDESTDILTGIVPEQYRVLREIELTSKGFCESTKTMVEAYRYKWTLNGIRGSQTIREIWILSVGICFNYEPTSEFGRRTLNAYRSKKANSEETEKIELPKSTVDTLIAIVKAEEEIKKMKGLIPLDFLVDSPEKRMGDPWDN